MPVRAFLQDQLDYIFFFYGLAFLLLGAVCFALKRFDREVLPWNYLGLFGITHGLNEWLDLFALIAGDSPAFQLVRLVVLVISFVFLLEFGRVGVRRLKGEAPGRWIFPLLIAAVILGGNLDLASASALARYGLGFIGACWAGDAFFVRAAREKEPSRARTLRVAGASFVLYAVFTGLIVPRTSFFPGSIINHDSFARSIGIPVQLIRGILACSIAVSVWTYAYRTFERGGARVSAETRPYFGWTLAGLGLIISLGWTITNQLGRIYENQLRGETSEDTRVLAHGFQGRMQRGIDGVNVLARSPLLSIALSSRAPGAIRNARIALADFVDAIPGATAYLLDPRGDVLTSSGPGGRKAPVPASWKDFPFFKDAAAGKPGAQFDESVTQGPPVFFAGSPVTTLSGELLGVIAVRSLLDPELELKKMELCFLVDPQGRVVSSNRPELLNQPLWMGSPTAGRAPFEGELSDGMKISYEGINHLVGRVFLKPTAWSFVLLKPEKTSIVNRMFGIIITLLLSSLTLGYYVALQREVNTEAKLEQSRNKLTELARRLEVQSITDTLTGIDNRLRFNSTLDVEMARSRRYGGALSLIMCDIDHFKQVNDQFGHRTGDQVLVRIARLLKDNIRQTDVVARWGGEEFMLLLPNTDFQAAATLAETLRHTVELTDFAGPRRLSCSFGVSQFRNEDTLDSFTSRVDEALYRAKSEGRNRVEAA